MSPPVVSPVVVPGRQRREVEGFEAWHDTVSRRFAPMDALPAPGGAAPAVFRASIDTVTLGDTTVSEIAADPHGVRRTPRLIAREEPGRLKLTMMRAASCRVEHAGRRAVLGPGGIAAYDTGRPYALHFDRPYRAHVVAVDREAVGPPTGAAGSPGAVRLLADTLDLVFTGAAPPADLADLVRAVLGVGRLTPAGVRGWIEEHLDDPTLDPESVAAAHHVSLRGLHKLFAADETTVGAWIRARRLEHCRRDLADPLRREKSVSAVAARWGLVDAAQFSKAFRARFGVSPREHRARHLAVVHADTRVGA